MFTIKLNSTSIDYNLVTNYYNSYKSDEENELEEIPRIEGGFQIKKKDTKPLKFGVTDCNHNYHQLRWSKGNLCLYSTYSGFTIEQLELLYNSLDHVYPNMVEKKDCIMTISGITRSTLVMQSP